MSNPLHIPFERFPDADELPPDEQELLRAALEATELAYAPYSRFQVGCAVQLLDGEVLTGNNQENVAYPSGLCAERTVLYYCGAQGKGDQLVKMAIRARSSQAAIVQPVPPCGACRLVMFEYERMSGRDIVVLMQGESGEVLRVTGVAKTLLPFSFDIEF